MGLPHLMIFFILIIPSALIVLNGMTTEVSLGDESHHYRFAQNIYETGKRVPFDPLYESGNPPGFYNNDPPLWHFGLAFLWKITGWGSQTIAQIYHVLFFILLVWCTSLLAKEITGEESRWFPALVIATVPMVVTFSTLLYMDIPMTALSTLGFYLIVRKRYIEAGVISGLMYFTKLNAAFFFPGFLFVLFWNERKIFRGFLKNALFFILPILMIYLPDLYWRKTNIVSQMDATAWNYVSYRLSMHLSGARWKEYLNSYLTNPIDVVKYFGLAFLFLMLVYLFRFRNWDRKGAILLAPFISYLILFLMIFGMSSDIRYLMPILPFLIILFTPSLLSLKKIWMVMMVGVCLLQFITTSYYVQQKRQIPPEVREGFEYIRKNAPPNALILYPEENLLIYGQRKVIWSALEGKGPALGGLYLLFWGTNTKEMEALLKANHIDHILIKKSRIFDDQKEYHTGGYPQSFVERLPHLPGWIKIFENSGVSLWKRAQP